jgi:hypothetical protein
MTTGRTFTGALTSGDAQKLPALLYVPQMLANRRDLRFIDKAVGGFLFSKMNSDGVCRRPQGEFADYFRVSVDTVNRSLKRLEEKGIVGHVRTGRANEYFLVWTEGISTGRRQNGVDLRELRPGDRITWRPELTYFKLRRNLLLCSDLKPSACLLYGALECHSRRGHCFPGDQTLAHEIAVGKGEVRQLRQQLARVGLIDYDATRTGDCYHLLGHILLSSATAPNNSPHQSARAAASSSAVAEPDPAVVRSDAAEVRHDAAHFGGDAAQFGPDTAERPLAYKEEEFGDERYPSDQGHLPGGARI